MHNYRTFCIVVTYCPDVEHLQRVLASITAHTHRVIVVDNTPGARTFIALPQGVQYIPFGRNLGIAAAQNAGIREALARGADVIWLSDQDTIYPEHFLPNMLEAMESCQLQGIRLAALGPSYIDTHKGAIQAFVKHTPFTTFFPPQPGLQKVAHAIASGTLIPTEVLREVGLMQENLFIDWVDLEWCWRAKNQFGYQTFCTGDVIIEHTMGDGSIRFLWRKVGVRTPLRRYYMVRNAAHIALHSRSATVPIRVEAFVKAFYWALVFPLIAPSHKSQHLHATLTGLWDGLRNHMGQKL